MPYILNKTNGNVLTVVEDASLDVSTDLTFVGRNYSGYGEIQNENFLKLLENFSNSTQPTKPILGQLWFNSTSDEKKLSVYDGKQFKNLANIFVSSSLPTLPLKGDLWWDSLDNQLKVYDGSEYKIIGPQGSARASWEVGEELLFTTSTLTTPILKGKIGSNTIAIVANTEFETINESSLQDDFPLIKKGITLPGTNESGSSKEEGYYLWGTASDSLVSSTATNVSVTTTTTNKSFYVTFSSTLTGGTSLLTHSGISYNPSTGVLNTIASSARYADLAERYESDGVYEVGTVVVIGGKKEITLTHTHADPTVLGVISTNPAYMMNADAGEDKTHPYVALRGRVPCKVIGTIKKGDLLVTSSYPGYAEAMKSTDKQFAVLGRSLENFDGVKGTIEIVV